MPVRNVDRDTIVLGGVDEYDAPDYADAFIQSAKWEDGTELTDYELDKLDKDGFVLEEIWFQKYGYTL